MDATSISGSWVLDLARSDTMEAYLRCLQTRADLISPQILKEQSCASRNVFEVQQNCVIISKQTAVNNVIQRHCLDADQIVHTRFGESRSMVSLLHYQGRAHGLVTTSTIPDGENEFYLVETRELIDNGMAHTQVLHLHNLTTDEQTTTRRRWVRVPMTPEDRLRLSV